MFAPFSVWINLYNFPYFKLKSPCGDYDYKFSFTFTPSVRRHKQKIQFFYDRKNVIDVQFIIEIFESIKTTKLPTATIVESSSTS